MNYIYTRSNPPCPWCTKVKDLLNAYGIPFEEYDISLSEVAEWAVFVKNGFKTVPQVYLNNVHIGGFEATAAYLRGSK